MQHHTGWQQSGGWRPLPPIQCSHRSSSSTAPAVASALDRVLWLRRTPLPAYDRLTTSTLAAIVSPSGAQSEPLYSSPPDEDAAASCSHVVLWLYEWVVSDADDVPRRLRWILVAAAWTRYEAWLVIASGLLAALFAMWRRGVPASAMIRRACLVGVWPVVAVALFLVNSRITVGSWFVTGGFYVPDPTYQGLVVKSLISVWWGTHQMSGYIVEIAGLLAAAYLAVRALTRAADARG